MDCPVIKEIDVAADKASHLLDVAAEKASDTAAHLLADAADLASSQALTLLDAAAERAAARLDTAAERAVSLLDQASRRAAKTVADASWHAAEVTVTQMFTRMGMDTNNPLRVQADFAALRSLVQDADTVSDLVFLRWFRKQLQGAATKIGYVIITLILGGLAAILWKGWPGSGGH